MVIFAETLRRNWRQSVYWGLVFAFFAGYAGILVPDMEGMQNYLRILEAFPAAMLQVFGLEDVRAFATPEGFVSFSYFVYMAIGVSIFGVVAGLNVTIAEEDRGILDMLLAQPVQRWQVVIGRFAAYAALMVIVVLFGVAALIGTDALNDNFAIETGRYLSANFMLWLYGLMVMAVTLLISTVVRSRGLATVLAAGFVGGSYMIDTIGGMANNDTADMLRNLSYFRHYDGMSVLTRDIEIVPVLVLVTLSAALVALSVGFFQRRDVGV